MTQHKFVCPCADLLHVSNITIPAATIAAWDVHASLTLPQHAPTGRASQRCASNSTCCLLRQCMIILTTQLAVKASDLIS
jgi:hypothetical protein